MTPLKFGSYVFDPRPRYPLVATAKGYWHPQPHSEDPDALTFIFAHGIGFYNEQWEPTLEFLYDILSRNEGVKIREAWSIDCPNHGDASALKEEELSWGYRQCTSQVSFHVNLRIIQNLISDVVPWGDYTRSLHDFLTGQGKDIPVNFSSREPVGIGHSMGAVALYVFPTHHLSTCTHLNISLPRHSYLPILPFP